MYLPFLAIIIFGGNGLTIASYVKFPYIRGSLYILTCHLAAADILFGVHVLLYPMEELFTIVKYHKFYCYGKFAIVRTFMCSSLCIHIILAIDRYMAIKCR